MLYLIYSSWFFRVLVAFGAILSIYDVFANIESFSMSRLFTSIVMIVISIIYFSSIRKSCSISQSSRHMRMWVVLLSLIVLAVYTSIFSQRQGNGQLYLSSSNAEKQPPTNSYAARQGYPERGSPFSHPKSSILAHLYIYISFASPQNIIANSHREASQSKNKDKVKGEKDLERLTQKSR